MIFAFLLLAEVATGFMVAGLIAMAAGAGVSIYSGYQAQSAANQSARMQEDAANAAANAQRMAAQAQADQLRDQAELAALQANVEDKKSAVAQEQGQIERQRRMIALADSIGAAYAQYAGSNLLVDNGNDTLGQLLTANTREAAQDIGIIKSNEENAVWEHDMNKSMALITQKSYEGQAASALKVGEAGAYSTLLSGEAQAYATRQQGLTALYSGWSGGLSMLGSAAMMGYGAFKPAAGAAATPKTNGVYAWDTTRGYGFGNIA